MTVHTFASRDTRRRIELLVELLIDWLDQTGGDPDDEPGDNGIADLDALLVIEAQLQQRKLRA